MQVELLHLFWWNIQDISFYTVSHTKGTFWWGLIYWNSINLLGNTVNYKWFFYNNLFTSNKMMVLNYYGIWNSRHVSLLSNEICISFWPIMFVLFHNCQTVCLFGIYLAVKAQEPLSPWAGPPKMDPSVPSEGALSTMHFFMCSMSLVCISVW